MLRRFRRETATAVVLVAMLSFAACSDDRDTGAIAGPGGVSRIEAPDLDTQINTLIQALYPAGPRAAVTARWQNVKRQSVRNPSGRTQYVRLVEWVQQNAQSITPAPDEDQAHAAARLVLLMSLYVFHGPEFVAPTVTPTTDATLKVVHPAKTDTAKTPSEQAAVVFPQGATNEPTVVVISKVEEHFPKACSGPLPTSRCQYPQFYRFDVFPDVPLNTPATVALCHVTQGSSRTPLADDHRFLIAHEAPPTAEGRHPEGVIEEGIEILPLVTVGTLVECEDNEYPTTAMVAPDAGPIAKLAARARWGVGYVAHVVGRALTPKSLYAIDRGGGGELFLFSTFGTVDPESRPDATPSSGFSVSSSSAARGEEVTVNAWSIDNVGNGDAVQVASSIVLAQDSALTTNALTLATLPVAETVPPNEPHAMAAATVVIPETLAAGNYWIGVSIVPGGLFGDADVSNNFASVPITVTDPYTLFCPSGASPAYADLRAAVVATPEGGTIRVCDGTWDVDTVVVDKPLTLTSLNSGGNAWIGDVDQSATGVQGGRPAIIIDGYAAGTVRIANLGFRMKGRAIQLGRFPIGVGGTPPVPATDSTPAVPGTGPTSATFPGLWDQVEIDSVRFLGRNSDFGIGVQVWQNGAGVGRLDVTNSHFDTFGLGVFVTSHTETNVSHSTFENFTAGSVTFSGFNGTSDPSYHRLAFGRVEDNVMRNCGENGCMRMVLMANGTIARNVIEAGTDTSKLFGIFVQRPGNTPHSRLPIVIEDNQMLGGALPGDPQNPASWAIQQGVRFLDEAGVTSIVRRNEIQGAWTGVFTNAELVVHDNAIDTGFMGIQKGGPNTVLFNRNDITNTVKWFTWSSGGDFRCNWWGTSGTPPSGAVNPPGTPIGAYEPRATEPIANKPAVECVPIS